MDDVMSIARALEVADMAQEPRNRDTFEREGATALRVLARAYRDKTINRLNHAGEQIATAH